MFDTGFWITIGIDCWLYKNVFHAADEMSNAPDSPLCPPAFLLHIPTPGKPVKSRTKPGATTI